MQGSRIQSCSLLRGAILWDWIFRINAVRVLIWQHMFGRERNLLVPWKKAYILEKEQCFFVENMEVNLKVTKICFSALFSSGFLDPHSGKAISCVQLANAIALRSWVEIHTSLWMSQRQPRETLTCCSHKQELQPGPCEHQRMTPQYVISLAHATAKTCSKILQVQTC